MQYLNTMLWENFDKTVSARIPDAYPEDPKVTVIDENWKRSKCNLLGITFESTCEQPSNIVGRSLRDYEPSKTETIIGDGNCLFRCLSKINTGSENSLLQLRCIISRFIASEGTTKLGWYFISKQTTPCEYLLVENLVYRESIRESDVGCFCSS